MWLVTVRRASSTRDGIEAMFWFVYEQYNTCMYSLGLKQVFRFENLEVAISSETPYRYKWFSWVCDAVHIIEWKQCSVQLMSDWSIRNPSCCPASLCAGSPLLRPSWAPAKKRFFSVRFVWASSQKGLRSGKKKARRAPKKTERPQILERPLWPNAHNEAVGENFLLAGA
jgi:hypothetical protein